MERSERESYGREKSKCKTVSQSVTYDVGKQQKGSEGADNPWSLTGQARPHFKCCPKKSSQGFLNTSHVHYTEMGR